MIIVRWCPAADSREPTRISFIHSLEKRFYSEKSSYNGGRWKKGTHISLWDRTADEELFVNRWCIHTSTPTSCCMEWCEQSDLSSDVAAIFTHGGSRCSSIWFYCDNIMAFQGQCSHWNVKKGEKILWKMKKCRQRRMWIHSCLSRPLWSVWLFFNAFTAAPFSFFTLHLQYTNKGTSGLYPPLTPTPPLSDHFILHPNPCWLLCTLSPPSPPLAYVPPSPLLSSVSPSFLVAVSLW